MPRHTPGGGGWSIQQLTLSNLYTQNSELFNYWTKSNNRLNLCRYFGCVMYLFRNDNTDYVFSYFPECPKTVTKYFYASWHPFRMLLYGRKKIIPSFATQPHKRKPYKRIFIPPPKAMKNQWFFQQHFSQSPLVQFAVSACTLNTMFGSPKYMNNNCSIYCLDTTFFKNPTFQYPKTPPQQGEGYKPNNTTYLWGLPHAHEPVTHNKLSDASYLGNSMMNDPGDQVNNNKSTSTYTWANWGNPFYWGYMTGSMPIVITQATSKETLNSYLEKAKDTSIEDSMIKKNPYVFTIRYNPFKDKGTGNQAYFIPTYAVTKNDWEPTNDPDLLFENFPFWLMLWGIEDIIKRMGKCPHLDDDWILVLRSNYFNTPEKQYVPLSYNFIHGLPPYSDDREDITTYDNGHWYPKFKFQREAIENIINTGPAVCRFDNSNNIQALVKYKFLFKWGGNPAPMESVYDPTTQPITPIPSGLQLSNEINDPQTPVESFLYQWDTRRSYITPKSAKAITDSSISDCFMFTDGRATSTDLPLFQEKTQEEKTTEEENQTLLLQLHQLEQLNNQLRQRLHSLKQL